MRLENIYKDETKQILKKTHVFDQGLLTKKLLYDEGLVQTVWLYQYDEHQKLIQIKKYNATEYKKLMGLDFDKKIRRRKRKKQRIDIKTTKKKNNKTKKSKEKPKYDKKIIN